MENNLNVCNSSVESADYLKDLHYRIGNMSLELVQRRYDSLLSSASHIMSCVSILSIALVTLLPQLINSLDYPLRCLTIVFASIIFFLLFCSLFLSLFSRFRFGYKILNSPSSLASYLKSTKEQYGSIDEYGEFYCNCLNDSYCSIQKINNKISSAIKLSTIILMISIGLIVVFGFALLCCYFLS